MADNWKKKERENKKQQQKKSKEEKKLYRKENQKDGNDLNSMIAYVDENGNLSSKPPDPAKKKVFNSEDMVIGVPQQLPPDPAEQFRNGTVAFFNSAKGFGFIRDHQTEEKIFVHANSLSQMIKENDKVSFEIEMAAKGPAAVNVKITG